MNCKTFCLTFTALLSNSAIWFPERTNDFIYFKEECKFTMKLKEDEELLKLIGNRLNWLITSQQFFHPFFDSENQCDEFFWLLIFYQFSQKRKEKQLKFFSPPREFFLSNHSNSFVRVIFRDQRINSSCLSYNEKRNLKILQSIRKNDFEAFITFFKDFQARYDFMILISVLNFQNDQKLYQILQIASNQEIYNLRNVFQYDHILMGKIDTILTAKFLEVEKFFSNGQIEFAKASYKKISAEKSDFLQIELDSFNSDSDSD